MSADAPARRGRTTFPVGCSFIVRLLCAGDRRRRMDHARRRCAAGCATYAGAHARPPARSCHDFPVLLATTAFAKAPPGTRASSRSIQVRRAGPASTIRWLAVSPSTVLPETVCTTRSWTWSELTDAAGGLPVNWGQRRDTLLIRSAPQSSPARSRCCACRIAANGRTTARDSPRDATGRRASSAVRQTIAPVTGGPARAGA